MKATMGDKPRILVVDDEVGVRESLHVILRPRYDLVTVESGEAALQALSTFHPDVVFLDIKMPTPDGLEVLQRIKAHDRTIEVVMITAYASFETLRKSLTDGAFEYLIKPFSRHQVEETVRRALARRTGERGAAGPKEASGRVSIGLVGGGTGGSALLDLLLEWVPGKVAVIVDPRPDAPALSKARTLGIPTAEHHREVFAYPVDLVLEATGQPAVLDDLVRTKPPGVEVIGSGSLRFFWDLLQDKVTATRQLRAQLDMALALESTLDWNQQVMILTRKLAQACGADRCSFFRRDEATGLVIPVMAQFATGETNERMWSAFQGLGTLKLVEIPFLYEAMERQGPIAIDDPASNPLVPPGWMDRFEFKSLLVVPIFRKNRVVGVCVLDYCREARRFTPDQTVLASALASQVALALENAGLYQEVAEKADRLVSLLEATKRTVAIKDSRQLLPWIAQEAATCLKAEGAGIRILEGEELVYAGHYGYSRDGMRDRIGLGESGTGWVVRHNQPLAIPDIERDPRMVAQHRTEYCREGFHSMLAVPMRVAERAIGALFVFTKSLRQFSATEVEILSGFADQAALAVENLLLYEEAERRRREADVLAELGRNVTASLDLDTVLQRVAEGAKELCGSDLAQIALRDPGSDAMVVRYVVGTRYEGYDNIRIEAGKGLGGQVLLAGRPMRTDHYAEDGRLTKDYLQVIRAEGIIAEMVVPIRIEDRIEGLLYAANRSPRPFSGRHEAILQQLADHAAIAIKNAQLFSSERTFRAAAESSETRFRHLVQGLDAIVWEADAATVRFNFVSQRAEAILGYPVDQWLREPDFWLKHLHPEDQERTMARARAAVSAGEDYRVEYRMVAADARAVWLRDRVHVVPDPEGRPSRLQGVMVDITQRKQAEEALQRLSQQNELILTSAGEGIYGLDSQGLTTFVNPAAAALLGWTAEELVGQPQHAMIHHSRPDGTPYPRDECPIYAAFKDGSVHRVANEVFWRKDGTSFPVEYSSTPIRDAVGELMGAVVTFRDISERQQLEAQLRQAQKMEAVGQLAGGIAHDFNNLLSVIYGRIQLLRRRLKGDIGQFRDLDLLQETAQRASALIQQLLTFSRKQVLQPTVLDLNGVVSEVSTMLRRLIGEPIDLRTVMDLALGHVKVDRVQIEQVIVNLAVNARDAMPEGGQVTLQTANVELDETFARKNPGARPGPHVMLAVSDTGIGMDPATQARIFEPFFTTKGPGKGTGLGLSTVYGIVKQSDGHIAVESELGRGATFRVYLPRVAEPAESVSSGAPVVKPSQRQGTILVVDDEEAVRELVRDILVEEGYSVLAASEGPEALRICEEHTQAIHLLLTDVVMPKMSGVELGQRARTMRPDARVLYMSGYLDTHSVQRGALEPGAVFLQKPFTPDALLRKVQEVLEASIV